MYGEVFYSGEVLPDIPPDFCEAIIQLSNNIGEQEANVLGNSNSNVRTNSVFPIDDENFKKIVLSWIERANIESGWWFDITGVENLQLSKYTEGEKYSWHYDLIPGNKVRKLTFTVSLNDDYEGGNFQFSFGQPNWKYKKRTIEEPALNIRGKFVVFPSYYFHRVLPVTKGTRYSLTGWAYGPPFR
jgi:PKHD-type hydroxylase|tara:strand:- start:683 stop:1240 length:558 start_codon:yes stop_codon:yes gene_type:complete